jgi:hypothetical protein
MTLFHISDRARERNGLIVGAISMGLAGLLVVLAAVGIVAGAVAAVVQFLIG